MPQPINNFENFIGSRKQLGDLEDVLVAQGEGEDRQERVDGSIDQLNRVLYGYDHSLGGTATPEQIAENDNLRNHLLNGYSRDVRNSIGQQFNPVNIDNLISNIPSKTLDRLVTMELANQDQPLLSLKMDDNERKVYQAYAGVAHARELLKAVETRGVDALPEELRDGFRQGAAQAYAEKRQKELEAKHGDNKKDKMYYKEMQAVSLITAMSNKDLIREYAIEGAKKQVEASEKAYAEASRNGLDIKNVVGNNIKRLAQEKTKVYQALKERLYTAHQQAR